MDIIRLKIFVLMLVMVVTCHVCNMLMNGCRLKIANGANGATIDDSGLTVLLVV